MAANDDAVVEIKQLRRTMRDLVALSTLPAIWTGFGPEGIARSLADALLSMLSLDVVYIQLESTAPQSDIQILRTKQHLTEAQAAAAKETIQALLDHDATHSSLTIPDPVVDGELQTAITRFGFGNEIGVLVTASRNPDFPTEQDRLLLGVGANQTAIVLGRLRTEVEVQAQREWLRVTLASIGDGVITTDPQGNVTYLNSVAQKLTGWSQKEAFGQPLTKVFQIVSEATRQTVDNPAIRALEWGAIVGLANHTILISKDGTECPIDDSAAPIREASTGTHGAVLIFRDITERRQQEREREAKERELQKLAAGLSAADRRKDEFLATLAHELRNPLAPIRTGLEVLRMAENDPALIEQVRETMERQSQQMVRLIDDLLEVSRITQGKLELRKCQVVISDIVRSAVEAAQPLIDDSRHELTVSLPSRPVFVDGDPSRLAQVISNLINNSAKYTPEGGQISLTVQRGEDEVLICVKDNGIGIPLELQESIFEMFSQIDRSMEVEYKGLGIGLTLVKQLVEMHDGSVEVHSEGTDKGSEFIVKLPALATSTNQSHESALGDETQPAQKLRVLVVDDNAAAAKMLAMVVKLLGHEIQTAGDGLQAIQVAQEFLPQVILMDIGMPKMNGYEAAKQIRAQPWGESICLIALTGWGQDQDRQLAMDAGFNHHLVKPAEPSEIQRLLVQVKR